MLFYKKIIKYVNKIKNIKKLIDKKEKIISAIKKNEFFLPSKLDHEDRISVTRSNGKFVKLLYLSPKIC